MLCAETEEERDEWFSAMKSSGQVMSPLKKAHLGRRESGKKLNERTGI